MVIFHSYVNLPGRLLANESGFVRCYLCQPIDHRVLSKLQHFTNLNSSAKRSLCFDLAESHRLSHPGSKNVIILPSHQKPSGSIGVRHDFQRAHRFLLDSPNQRRRYWFTIEIASGKHRQWLKMVVIFHRNLSMEKPEGIFCHRNGPSHFRMMQLFFSYGQFLRETEPRAFMVKRPLIKIIYLPSGKRLHSYSFNGRKWQLLYLLRMLMFHSYISLPEGSILLIHTDTVLG